jgi:glutamine amidotransferase
LCRLIALIAEGGKGLAYATQLIDLLIESAAHDPLLEATGRGSTHCDGFGYYVVARVGGSMVRMHERFDSADTIKDPVKACQANLELARRRFSMLASLVRDAEEVAVVAHARLAGDRPRGTWFAQPIVHYIQGRYGRTTIALAHNGRFDSSRLSMLLGVDPQSYSDTEMFTVWLARQLSFGQKVDMVLKDGFGFAITGYNLAVAIDTRSSLSMYCVSATAREVKEPERIRYYRHYVVKGEGIVGFVSSTVRDYAIEKGLPVEFEDAFNKVVELARGEVKAIATLG